MKRIISVILAVLLMVTSTIAFSDETFVDLSSYTIDELVRIRNAFNDEICRRLEYSITDEIYIGDYVVGKNIKPGGYVFESTSDYAIFNFQILSDTDDREVICHYTLLKGYKCYVELLDGFLLRVLGGSAAVIPYNNPSWAP